MQHGRGKPHTDCRSVAEFTDLQLIQPSQKRVPIDCRRNEYGGGTSQRGKPQRIPFVLFCKRLDNLLCRLKSCLRPHILCSHRGAGVDDKHQRLSRTGIHRFGSLPYRFRKRCDGEHKGCRKGVLGDTMYKIHP